MWPRASAAEAAAEAKAYMSDGADQGKLQASETKS